jgi:hypothetical protein
MTKLTAAARAAWAKQLVADSAPVSSRDPRDLMSNWERDTYLGFNAVQLRIPLRDPLEARHHLALVEQAFRELRLRLEQAPAGDRSDLLTIQATVRTLTKKLNAVKTPTR